MPGRVALLVSMLVHEPLELLAIPAMAEISKNSAKRREFSGAPFDQGAIPRAQFAHSPAFTMLTTKPARPLLQS